MGIADELLLDLLNSLYKLGFIDISDNNEAYYTLIDLHEERKYFLHKAEEDKMFREFNDMSYDKYK